MKRLAAWFIPLIPWRLRRWMLIRFWGFQIAADAKIGLSWVFPIQLNMEAGTYIGHLTIVKGLQSVDMREHSRIGNLNWITGFPANDGAFFGHQETRNPRLEMGRHSAITNRHLVDCTDEVRIGAFTTLAGFRTQILTHSIDLAACRQHAEAVEVGSYCFIGTGCIILSGSRLPNYCVLGAGSMLNKKFDTGHRLYGGVPAREIKELEPGLEYFRRTQGYVH